MEMEIAAHKDQYYVDTCRCTVGAVVNTWQHFPLVVHDLRLWFESWVRVLSLSLSLSLSWKVPLMKRKIEGWLANQAVRRKQLKICNRFLIVSSSAGALMHSLNGCQGGRRIHSFVKWSLRMLLFGYQ